MIIMSRQNSQPLHQALTFTIPFPFKKEKTAVFDTMVTVLRCYSLQ